MAGGEDRGVFTRMTLCGADVADAAVPVVTAAPPDPVVPWEQIRLPHEVDGSHGAFRAPRQMCTLDANNDYEAIGAWLALHESTETERAYRKEAERLLLWAILERGKALSSLTTEDASAYRAFLRRPTPHQRWVAPARPRTSPEWRPFTGALSPRSIAYALSVLGGMLAWLLLAQMPSMFSSNNARANWVWPLPLVAPCLLTRKTLALSL